jgi:myo-inositol-1(or 4)-monophosphatase
MDRSGSQEPAPTALALELLRLARSVVVEAGTLIRSQTRAAASTAAAKSTPTDLVTATDRASEAQIIRTLLEARPQDGILAEESNERAGTTGVRWVIDPLDGTTNFVYGVPSFAVSVAAELDGRAMAAAVHDVPRARTYSAARDGGAFLDGRPIATTSKADLATALIATGFGYSPARRANQAAVLSRMLPRIRDIRRVGAAALDLCWVAEGRVDGYYEQGVQPWDVAAGGLIVIEAGGRAEWLGHTTPATYTAAGPALFPLLASALAE